MKKFTSKLGLFILVSALSVSAGFAQKSGRSNPDPDHQHDHGNGKKGHLRCGTMEHLEVLMQNDPSLRASYNKSLKDAEERAANPSANATARTGEAARTNTIVTIPVVVHIVHPSANLITDADVYEQIINRLNLDYSGNNPDSTNAVNFYNVRGRSNIRFCLAKRDQNGNFTTGIERRISSTGYNVNAASDPIKSTATGGLNTWGDKYFNIWVGTNAPGSTALLGYATFPGTSTPEAQGVVIDVVGFGGNRCYVDPSFAMGRTLAHEAGHYFGLYHIWGDVSGCGGDDFRQMPAAGTCQLPAQFLVGDTPAQSGPTSGCPTGVANNTCAPNPPGRMYQNYMDYTDDACYSMFTRAQVGRMEWVLANCRANLVTSDGCVVPANAILLDAAAGKIVAPGGNDVVAGACVSYPVPSCAGPFVPRLQVSNRGATTLTSVRVGVIVNGGAPVINTYTVNLATGDATTIVLPAQNLIVGSNTIRMFTSSPNGGGDQVVSNDTLATTITIAGGLALPVAENFVNTAFPPANFTLFNGAASPTQWTRSAQGAGNAGSAFYDNYGPNTTGQIKDLRTRPISTSNVVDSVVVTFDVAHRRYFTSNDRLQVLVSGDCGNTFTVIFDKAGAALSTGAALASAFTTPTAAEWRNERVAIGGSLVAGGSVIFAFRNISDFGNNTFVDNINITRKVSRDLAVTAVTRPFSTECTNTVAPTLTVRNQGAETITAFTLGYILDNGTPVSQNFTQTLAPNATFTATLPQFTSGPGNRSLRAYCASPVSVSGTGDQEGSNDTLVRAFVINNIVTGTIVDDLESQVFPTAGWSIVNTNNNVTWVRRSPGFASANALFIDNYNFNLPGQTDRYISPTMRTTGADSVVFSFDLAHRNYPGSIDVLTILASTDCGNTFTPVWTRSGAALATAGSSTADYIAPANADWRRQRVALGGAFVSTGSIIFAVQNTNDYGNNIFVDNINISPVFGRDLAVTAINAPGALICSGNFTPSATVRNVGLQTLTGFQVAYSVDGGAPVTTAFTGTLLRDSSRTVALPAASVSSVGAHSITIYSINPISSTGTGDANNTNDTLRRAFSLAGTSSAPLVETFETSTVPTAGWSVVNADNSTTWAKASVGANRSTGSAFVRNFSYNFRGQRDDLYSPIISYSGVDSVFLTFDVAAATKNYAGATRSGMDTLEVLVTRDCGTTFTSVYKKWGADLQTINDPNSTTTSEFQPSIAGFWRTERVNLSAVAASGPVQVVFRNTTNNENNVYVDNVNFNTKTLAARLKANGYMFSPNPTRNITYLQHYLRPVELRGVGVFNSVGQQVVNMNFSGNADSIIPIDMTGLPAGVYMVKLDYLGKTITDKIIKLNN